MSAIVHFVVFAPDGVIVSAVTGMPGARDFVEKADAGGNPQRAPIVKSASGCQRFACGVAPSKWWAKTDANGALHVASGEPERVSCEACKQSKEYRDATGQSDSEGTIIAGGETRPVPAAGSDVTGTTGGGTS